MPKQLFDTNQKQRELLRKQRKTNDVISTATVSDVDRISKTATARFGLSGSAVTLSIASQELADVLAGRVAAGDRPSVTVNDNNIIDAYQLRASGGGRSSGPGIAGQPVGSQVGPTIPAPLWDDNQPLTAGVLSVRIAWLPLVGVQVLGYRVQIVDSTGFATIHAVDGDRTLITLPVAAGGLTRVRVQAIGVGGIGGDYSSERTVTVLADTTPPALVTNLRCNWNTSGLALVPLDLRVQWTLPSPLPPDWYGVEVRFRNPNKAAPTTMTIPGNQEEVTYFFSTNQSDGVSAVINVDVRTKDTHGNTSEWVSLTCTYPDLAAPTVAPLLTAIFKQVQVSLPDPSARVSQTEVSYNSNAKKWLIGRATSTLFTGATNTPYTVTYRWADAFGRFTAYAPATTITIPKNEIGFDDLNVLEQVVLLSTVSRTDSELRKLVDSQETDIAFTVQAGEVITLTYPIARMIAGLSIYCADQATPQWYLRYKDERTGNILCQGSNGATNHTLLNAYNGMVMREFVGSTTSAYIEEQMQAYAGRYFREYRFGDGNSNAAARKTKPITTRSIELVFQTAVNLAEIKILTYEAASVFVGRRLYLSEGLQLVNDAGTSGFEMTSQYFRGLDATGSEVGRIGSDGSLWWKRGGFGGTATSPSVALTDAGIMAGTAGGSRVEFNSGGVRTYLNNVEQVALRTSDGALTAGAGRIRMDANKYIQILDANLALKGVIGYDTIPPPAIFSTPESSGIISDTVSVRAGDTSDYARLYVTKIGGRSAGLQARTASGVESYLRLEPSQVSTNADLRVDGDINTYGHYRSAYTLGGIVCEFAAPPLSANWNNVSKSVAGYFAPVSEWGVPSDARGVFLSVTAKAQSPSDSASMTFGPDSSGSTPGFGLAAATYTSRASGFVPITDGNVYIRVNGSTFDGIFIRCSGFTR